MYSGGTWEGTEVMYSGGTWEGTEVVYSGGTLSLGTEVMYS